MGKKSKYQETFDEILNKVKASAKKDKKPPVMTSKSDLTMLATALINSPDHVVISYDKKVKEADGSPLAIESRPAQRYRDSLKPVLRAMGIDKAEVSKIDDIPFSKEHGAALVDVAGLAIKDYMAAGRRYNFPITGTDESQMSLSMVEVDERVTMPNKFVTDENGVTVTVPTGKSMKTKKHKAIKAGNRNPEWLKDYTDLKK